MERDIAGKRLEEHGDVFADIFNVLLFDGKEVCKPESLEQMAAEGYHRSATGNLRQRTRDIIKRDVRNDTVLLIMGIENQSGSAGRIGKRQQIPDH